MLIELDFGDFHIFGRGKLSLNSLKAGSGGVLEDDTKVLGAWSDLRFRVHGISHHSLIPSLLLKDLAGEIES